MKFVLNISIIALLIFVSGCKTEVPDPSETLPDLVVSIEAKKDGTTIENINLELIEQQGSTGGAASGSHQLASGIFTMLASENLAVIGPKFGFTTNFSELKAMTIDLSTVGGSLPTIATYTTADAKTYQGSTGTVKFSKVDLYQDIGVGAADYFMDIEINLTLANPADASDIITVEGDLKGVNIKQQ